METTIQPQTVELRETDLFSVVCHALESGEFRQIRGQLYDASNGRCAWGVIETMWSRAGLGGIDYRSLDAAFVAIHPEFVHITARAARLLGHWSLEQANDAGEPFKVIAAALRRARIDVEAGQS